MRNYELIMAIYDRCPDFKERQYTLDQCLDRCLDIREMIERERPELNEKLRHHQRDLEGHSKTIRE